LITKCFFVFVFSGYTGLLCEITVPRTLAIEHHSNRELLDILAYLNTI